MDKLTQLNWNSQLSGFIESGFVHAAVRGQIGPAHLLRKALGQRLKPAVLSTPMSWAAKEDLPRLASGKTLRAHCQPVLDALDIDIRYPAADALGSACRIAIGAALSAESMFGANFNPDEWGCADVAYQRAESFQSQRRFAG